MSFPEHQRSRSGNIIFFESIQQQLAFCRIGIKSKGTRTHLDRSGSASGMHYSGDNSQQDTAMVSSSNLHMLVRVLGLMTHDQINAEQRAPSTSCMAYLGHRH